MDWLEISWTWKRMKRGSGPGMEAYEEFEDYEEEDLR